MNEFGSVPGLRRAEGTAAAGAAGDLARRQRETREEAARLVAAAMAAENLLLAPAGRISSNQFLLPLLAQSKWERERESWSSGEGRSEGTGEQ